MRPMLEALAGALPRRPDQEEGEDMFESITLPRSSHPHRRPALIAAGCFHAVLAVAILSNEALSVEAVSPPQLAPVFVPTISIPVAFGTPDATLIRRSPSRTTPAPGTQRQPVQPTVVPASTEPGP